MSDKELKLKHKLFAIVEGWVNSTRVHDVNVRPEIEHGAEGHVKDMDFSFEILNHSLNYHIPVKVADTPVQISTTTCEILQQLIQPQIYDASLQKIQAAVIDEEVEGIRDVNVRNLDQDIQFDHAPVNDFFKRFQISSKLLYTTSVKSVDIAKLKPKVKNTPIGLTAKIKENLRFFRRLAIERKTIELSYLDPKDQLILWKKAVEKTRKPPKDLTLLGVYTSIPYSCIETDKITVNPGRKILTYHYKKKIPSNPGPEQMRDIALFSITTADVSGNNAPSLIMVKK